MQKLMGVTEKPKVRLIPMQKLMGVTEKPKVRLIPMQKLMGVTEKPMVGFVLSLVDEVLVKRLQKN
ncbi:MAG: hypothetical protein Q9M50_09990 [Methylococcales bacterium]|nr:hypothetical protein [Methylococcales bacterium]